MKRFSRFFDFLDGIDFVKRSGKGCIYEARYYFDKMPETLRDAKDKCLSDKRCRSVLRRPLAYDSLTTMSGSNYHPTSCDAVSDYSKYYMCYFGDVYYDSPVMCVYEKTGTLFSFSGSICCDKNSF